MKGPLIAAAIVLLGFSIPALGDCGATHPQALSSSPTVVAQSSSDSSNTQSSDQGNKQSDDDDDND